MATGLESWSTTASSNASADSNVNWAEGQTPGSVNNSARALMASAAMWRKDNAGLITTGGTSTAYTATSNQSLSLTDGVTITLQMSATNGATPTLNVDSTGAKAIQGVSGTAIETAQLAANGLYTFTYRSSPDAWIVRGNFALPADLAAIEALTGTGTLQRTGTNTWALAPNLPIGAVSDYAGSSEPTGWLFCYGQAISRSTYSALFSVLSTTYGVGDGSTTFNLPDCRGRVVAGQDDMGGSSADRLTGVSGSVDGDTLGAAGGNTDGKHTHGPGSLGGTTQAPNLAQGWTTGASSGAHTNHGHAFEVSTGTTASDGGIQPTIILNKIIYAGV